MGSLFVNPIFLMPKNDYVKLVINVRHLKSVSDLTTYSWPLELVRMIMTRVNGKVFSVSDLSCAYDQVPLSPKTQELTSSSLVEDSKPTHMDSRDYVASQISLLG